MAGAKLSILAAATVLLWAVPMTAASSTAVKTNKSGTKAAAARSIWPPETISGKITMVDPDRKLIVVQTSDGVPYDIDVTAHTRIKSGDQRIALKNLTQDVNDSVSVKFIPERRGDIASTIQING